MKTEMKKTQIIVQTLCYKPFLGAKLNENGFLARLVSEPIEDFMALAIPPKIDGFSGFSAFSPNTEGLFVFSPNFSVGCFKNEGCSFSTTEAFSITGAFWTAGEDFSSIFSATSFLFSSASSTVPSVIKKIVNNWQLINVNYTFQN